MEFWLVRLQRFLSHPLSRLLLARLYSVFYLNQKILYYLHVHRRIYDLTKSQKQKRTAFKSCSAKYLLIKMWSRHLAIHVEEFTFIKLQDQVEQISARIFWWQKHQFWATIWHNYFLEQTFFQTALLGHFLLLQISNYPHVAWPCMLKALQLPSQQKYYRHTTCKTSIW